MTKEKSEKHKGRKNHFSVILNEFISGIEYIHSSVPIFEIVISLVGTHQFAEVQRLVSKGKRVDDNKTEISRFDGLALLKEMKGVTELWTSAKHLPRSFVIAMIAHYDDFLGAILRRVYSIIPGIIDESEKKFTFSELKQLDTSNNPDF